MDGQAAGVCLASMLYVFNCSRLRSSGLLALLTSYKLQHLELLMSWISYRSVQHCILFYLLNWHWLKRMCTAELPAAVQVLAYNLGQ